jgi:3-hydroxybutyrate dehydrogenase
MVAFLIAPTLQRQANRHRIFQEKGSFPMEIKEMMSPVDVGNLFVYGFSRFAKYLVGGDLLFDGGMVLTY